MNEMTSQLEQLLNNASRGTVYDLAEENTLIDVKFLQFKSTEKKINFLNLWNSKEDEVWRYIPSEENYINGYLNEKKCPTRIILGSEGRLISCISDTENFKDSGIIPFLIKYPDIQKYFEHFNQLRDQYLREKTTDTAPETALLSK